MKKQLIVTLASFLIVVAASAAKADSIGTWSAPVDYSLTPADVLTNGTIVAATAVYSAFNPPNTLTVNGVTFGYNNLTDDGSSCGTLGTGGSPGTADSDYNTLLGYECVGGRVFVAGLTAGDTYQLEIFTPYFASGGANPGPSEYVLTDGSVDDPPSDLIDASSAVANGDPDHVGQYVVITFVSDTDVAILYSYNTADPEYDNSGGNGVLPSALVLIQDPTSPATPEPGTLLLLGSGLLTVGRFTRRKIAAQTKN